MSEPNTINVNISRDEFIILVARNLCRIRGVDPEAPVSSLPRPGDERIVNADGKVIVPMWEMMYNDAKTAVDVNDAIRFTVQQIQQQGVAVVVGAKEGAEASEEVSGA